MATLTQLQYLVAVDHHKHFGKAAKACHISQPTLSMQLQKLEQEYEITFFDRDKKPILPTPEGQPVIEQAKTILREMGKLDHLAKNRKDLPQGEFKLALIPTIAPYLLPLFLAQFARAYPQVTLTIEEMTTGQILNALDEDRIDAGILATPLHTDGLIEQPLFYEPFMLYVSKGHELARVDQIKEEKLDAKDIWLLAEGHCLRNQIVKVCSLRGKPGVFTNVRFESGSLSTVIHLVEQGNGYTLLPSLATRALAGSSKALLKPFAQPVPSREVSLVYTRSQYKKSILEALTREILKSLPASLATQKSKNIEVIKIK